MVIPIHDTNPARRAPVVTFALVVANIVIFLFTPASTSGLGTTTAASICQETAFLDRYAAIPREMIQNEPLRLVPTGDATVTESGDPACVIARPSYEKSPALSVLFAMFLHGGWLHLLGNMLFLWIFGNNIEDRLGHIGYAFFYLFCGFVAAYGFAAADPTSTTPLVGASGAIAGVLGAYLVLYPRAKVWGVVPMLFFIPLRLPAWLMLGMWFALQWIYSVGYAVSEGGSVAYLAHVIGFAAGVVIALLLRTFEGDRADPHRFPPHGGPSRPGGPYGQGGGPYRPNPPYPRYPGGPPNPPSPPYGPYGR